MRKLSYDGMTRVKVLPLEFWMDSSSRFKDELKRFESITPVFNRNGYYYNRVLDVCWFETDDKAFVYEVDTFKYTLESMCTRDLNCKQVSALVEIQAQGLSTKQQDRLLHMYACAMGARSTYRNARKSLHRMQRRRARLKEGGSK